MNLSMTFTYLDNPSLSGIEVTLWTKDGGRVLERGVDYNYNTDTGSITIRYSSSSSGVISITSLSGNTSVGVSKSHRMLSSKKWKQSNYRDILPKRARRW